MKRPIVHFCFGMTPDFGGRPFSLSHYLAIRSAWDVLKPECIILHYAYEPQGKWWDMARPLLHLHKVRPIKGIYGFPAAHPAHRADIIRLAALIAMGGIYLDTDVLVLRSFEHLLSAPFVAALEITTEGIVVGLSNAVLIAQPDAKFTQLCLDGHNPKKSLWKGFRSRGRDENYVELSVQYPCMLADLCPSLIDVLPSESFLWAGWDESGLKSLFEEVHQLDAGVLALHLWESHSWNKYLSQLTPEMIRMHDTTFNLIARKFLDLPSDSRFMESTVPPDAGALAKMDKICEDVDFVLPKYKSPKGLRRKCTRFLQRALNRLRDEMILPLRCSLENHERRLVAVERALGQPPPFIEVSETAQDLPVLRFGALDGSKSILEVALEKLRAHPIHFLMVTGSHTEPSACTWLATFPNASGLWASESLNRARQLSQWAIKTGSPIRCIHQSQTSPDLSRLMVAQLLEAPLHLLLLTSNGNSLDQWKSLMSLSPSFVLAVCNPLLVKLYQETHSDTKIHSSSEQLWGISQNELTEFAHQNGYRLITSSPDALFLLFERLSPQGSSLNPLEIKFVAPTFLIQTLYGHSFHSRISNIAK